MAIQKRNAFSDLALGYIFHMDHGFKCKTQNHESMRQSHGSIFVSANVWAEKPFPNMIQRQKPYKTD